MMNSNIVVCNGNDIVFKKATIAYKSHLLEMGQLGGTHYIVVLARRCVDDRTADVSGVVLVAE